MPQQTPHQEIMKLREQLITVLTSINDILARKLMSITDPTYLNLKKQYQSIKNRIVELQREIR